MREMCWKVGCRRCRRCCSLLAISLVRAPSFAAQQAMAAAAQKSPITTHILDTTRGKPAQGVPISLFLRDGDKWVKLGSG